MRVGLIRLSRRPPPRRLPRKIRRPRASHFHITKISLSTRQLALVAVLNSPLPVASLALPLVRIASPLRPSSNLGAGSGLCGSPRVVGVHAHRRCRARASCVRACWHLGFAETGWDLPRRRPATRQHFLFAIRRFL